MREQISFLLPFYFKGQFWLLEFRIPGMAHFSLQKGGCFITAFNLASCVWASNPLKGQRLESQERSHLWPFKVRRTLQTTHKERSIVRGRNLLPLPLAWCQPVFKGIPIPNPRGFLGHPNPLSGGNNYQKKKDNRGVNQSLELEEIKCSRGPFGVEEIQQLSIRGSETLLLSIFKNYFFYFSKSV